MAKAHIVVCDYWWLFSPMAQEIGLTQQAGFSPTDSIVIVDEAHNLAPRVRGWLDVDEAPDRLAEALRRTSPKAWACLEPVLDALAQAAIGEGLAPSALLGRIGGANAIRAALTELASTRQPDAAADASERILRLLLHLDDAVVIYPAEDSASSGRRLVFRLVDPTPILQGGYSRVHASLSMSGTLAAPSDNDDELRYQAPIFGLPLGGDRDEEVCIALPAAQPALDLLPRHTRHLPGTGSPRAPLRRAHHRRRAGHTGCDGSLFQLVRLPGAGAGRDAGVRTGVGRG